MNILITCGGKRNYLVDYFKSVIGANGKVIVTNNIENVSSMYRADIAIKAPGINTPYYIQFLINICREYNIDMLFSLFDQDLSVITKNKSAFEDIGVLVALSDFQTIEDCFNKSNLVSMLKVASIKTPKTYDSKNDLIKAYKKGEITFPIIIKPQFGSGSLAMGKCDSSRHLNIIVDYLNLSLENSYLSNNFSSNHKNKLLFQEYIEGVEYNIDIVNDFNGKFITTFVKEKLVRGTSENETVKTLISEPLFELGKRIGEYIKHIGIMDADIIERNGDLYVIDLNPRFGGGYPFSHMAGANIPLAYTYWAKNIVAPEVCFNISKNLIITKGIDLHIKKRENNFGQSNLLSTSH